MVKIQYSASDRLLVQNTPANTLYDRWINITLLVYYVNEEQLPALVSELFLFPNMYQVEAILPPLCAALA